MSRQKFGLEAWNADAARTGRPTAEVKLTGREQETPARWARRAKSSQVLAMRSKIVLSVFADGGDLPWAMAIGIGLYHNPPERAVVLCVDDHRLERQPPAVRMEEDR
ncbi:hypothetical protein [Streptosporangium vulgare]|uniref:Uncharacterized protein n=1 Tax=Streptosporangium vulgare TaxID=46190 RepID=A0ABV5TTR0_9ACTN